MTCSLFHSKQYHHDGTAGPGRYCGSENSGTPEEHLSIELLEPLLKRLCVFLSVL